MAVRFGKDVIETLTLGMYKDSEIVFREYVQNSADAIDDAIRLGLIEDREHGDIQINFDEDDNKIVVFDNGVGIKANEANEKLANIACSEKTSDDNKGFRGIGRLGGLAYCDKLIFETSYIDENIKSIMTWDAVRLRELISLENEIDASELIESIITYDQEETEDGNSHFFRVTLEGVNDPDLLDENLIKRYLEMVAPVPFGTGFHFRSKIKEKFDEYDITLDEYKIYLNGERLFKPYTKSITKKNGSNEVCVDRIEDIVFFEIKDEVFGSLALGWFGLSSFSQQIPQINYQRGLRLRSKNIQIGFDNTLNDLHKESRGNFYFIGEIHAISKSLRPNSNRDYFNHSDEVKAFEKHIKYYFEDLYRLYHFASKTKSAFRKITRYNEDLESYNKKCKIGFSSKEECDNIKAELEKKKEDADNAASDLETFKEKAKLQDNYKSVFKTLERDHSVEDDIKEIKQVKPKFRTQNLTKLTKKEKKLISKVYGVIDNFLPPDTAEILKDKIDETFK